MTHHHYPDSLTKLILFFKKLTGVGRKTAERYAFELLEWKKEEVLSFSSSLEAFTKRINRCQECNCIKENTCLYCTDKRRDFSILLVLSSAKDVYFFEETNMHKGLYHVLDHLINPIEGKGPSEIGIDKLLKRIENHPIKEIVIALDATLEADATALYLKKALENKEISLSRLAFGIPMGSSLEQVDEGTLTKALLGRGKF
jgi:recombination protein RecR